MAATQEVNQVSLKLVLNKGKDKVLFAEAGKDFVDVLFSFLTLPLGTIVRLVGKESNMQPVRVGCLSSLYDGVANLDNEYLWTETCKEMLLQPRNSMEAYCQKMKLNIDDTEPTKYFRCPCFCQYNWSAFKNLRCPGCGQLITSETSLENSNIKHGFVVETATFIICDELYVMPNVLGKSLAILQNLGIEGMEDILEQTVNVSEKEVLDLLKCSLFSKTPLTDIFLKKKQFLDNFNPRNQSQVEVREVPSDATSRKMVVKVLVRKSNGKILLAQAEEDFADFIFSFLTFPLGGVLRMLEGCSSLSCVDQLYKSLAGLSTDRYFISPELKGNLSKPKCAHQFKLNKQILPIDEACSPISGYYKFVNPKSSTGETSSTEGFAKGPSMYMVTDDLIVTPLSSSSCFCYLNRLKVPLSDLEERVISIGPKAGLSILKASLISTSALTNGLNHIINAVKKEK